MNFVTFNWMLPTVNETQEKTEVKEVNVEELRGVEYWQEKSRQTKETKKGLLGRISNLFR